MDLYGGIKELKRKSKTVPLSRLEAQILLTERYRFSKEKARLYAQWCPVLKDKNGGYTWSPEELAFALQYVEDRSPFAKYKRVWEEIAFFLGRSKSGVLKYVREYQQDKTFTPRRVCVALTNLRDFCFKTNTQEVLQMNRSGSIAGALEWVQLRAIGLSDDKIERYMYLFLAWKIRAFSQNIPSARRRVWTEAEYRIVQSYVEDFPNEQQRFSFIELGILLDRTSQSAEAAFYSKHPSLHQEGFQEMFTMETEEPVVQEQWNFAENENERAADHTDDAMQAPVEESIVSNTIEKWATSYQDVGETTQPVAGTDLLDTIASTVQNMQRIAGKDETVHAFFFGLQTLTDRALQQDKVAEYAHAMEQMEIEMAVRKAREERIEHLIEQFLRLDSAQKIVSLHAFTTAIRDWLEQGQSESSKMTAEVG